MSLDCVFCQIIRREIPAEILYEDDFSVIVRDINPVSPVHMVAMPKTHMESVLDAKSENIAHLYNAINKCVVRNGIHSDGFRLVTNTGIDAGQTINHFHVHILSGRIFSWPPG